jgi:hypothetical protein
VMIWPPFTTRGCVPAWTIIAARGLCNQGN